MSMSTAEVAEIQSDYNTTLLDTCVLGTHSGTATASWDVGGGTWTYATATVACGVNLGRPEEILSLGQAVMSDATIRLPIGTTLTAVQRIKVTKRHGTTLGTAEEYAVLGEPRRGIAGLTVHCQRVVGNSLL